MRFSVANPSRSRLLADGLSYAAVADKLDCSTPTVGKWKKRFLEHGLDGLETHRPGQPPSKLTVRLRAKILNATRRQPRDGSTHWSCRKLGKELSISKDLVHRVWREADLKPHRLERYMASNDPDFERKTADIIGLYLDPPRHAAVFCLNCRLLVAYRKDQNGEFSDSTRVVSNLQSSASCRRPESLLVG